MAKKILVTGGKGQVASALRELVDAGEAPKEWRFYFVDKDSLDITDAEAVRRFVDEHGIDTIVNCAAYTAVDAAEREPEAAYAVNRDAVENLARIAKEKDLWLIHLSTDYVFGGEHHSPIKEDAEPNPQGIYARSKLEGEEAIRRIAPKNATIIRTSWVYSHEGNNFVRTMRRLGRSRRCVDVVCDQIGTPTYAKDIAKALLAILKAGRERCPAEPTTYHFSDEGSCSWYDFAKAIFELSGIRCDVRPIATHQYPTPAKRPAYSVLDKSRIKEAYGLEIPYWRDSLKECIERMEQKDRSKKRIGIVGSGFIASGLAKLIAEQDDLELGPVLTRSDLSTRSDFPFADHLTNDLDRLIESCDLIVECSGDAIYATDTIEKILAAKIPVVTMNSEFHITTGSYFVDKGLLTEAEGDQPGVLAALHEEALSMGFRPAVYANIKGFLNENPTREEMEYWGAKSNLSLEMVTSFTDGTKVQIEQVFVANGLGANLIKEGLVKLRCDDMGEGGLKLIEEAKKRGVPLPVSDYVLSSKLPAGVFIVAEHADDQKAALRYYKLGEGPYYVLERTYHLCHLEIVKTIRRILGGGKVLLDNSPCPRYSVAAIAKHDIKAGHRLKKAIGSFDVRGEAVAIANHPDHVPIGLLADATFVRDVKEGEIVTFDDVELPPSRALEIWQIIKERSLKGCE